MIEFPLQWHSTHQKADARRAIALPFCDDSTLFFALRMRENIQLCKTAPPVHLVWLAGENTLSYRQLALNIPNGPDLIIENKSQMEALLRDPSYTAIIVSRVFRTISITLKSHLFKYTKARPCIVAFLGGLDFTPETGQDRRKNCDAVFLVPKTEIARFSSRFGYNNSGWQHVGFGHPAFIKPINRPNANRDIYFFAQAISPNTRRGRQHIVEVLAAIARAHPDRNVVIKLRHRPDENAEHLHKERFNYPSLVAKIKNRPSNLICSDGTMDKALSEAGIGITCTSTAAIDLIRCNIPTMVYLDFEANYLDPLVAPMECLFEKSNLITELNDLLCLKTSRPSTAWLNNMLCDASLGNDVLQTIDAFHKRPFQITR